MCTLAFCSSQMMERIAQIIQITITREVLKLKM